MECRAVSETMSLSTKEERLSTGSPNLRVVELFAGIGSQTQALKNLGIAHSVEAIAEIDKHAIKSYEAIHGPVNNLGDISKIERLPEADLWTYSFPCQDISSTGLCRGFAKTSGTRSGLLWEVERLLNASKLPQTLLMENVPMLLSERYKKDFVAWIRALSELGYRSFYGILNSKEFDIPQDRSWVFMISSLNGDVFKFPTGRKPTRKLKDVLETEVDERYYISPERTEGLLQHLKNKDTSRTIRSGGHDTATMKHNWDWVIAPVLTPDRPNKRQNGPRFRESDEMFTLTAQDQHGVLLNECPKLEKVGDIDIGNYDMMNRVYNPNGLCPTITANSGGHTGPKMIDIAYPNSELRRGRVGKGIAHSIMTSNGQAVLEPELRVRKLTPLECWRLMGFSDNAYYAAQAAGVSETQLYRQAGNSIVVDVLEAIFSRLYLERSQPHRQATLIDTEESV